jgi:two-component system chemotaxis response regulator CheB
MTLHQPLRVLVVDDTAFYRKIVCDSLAALPDVEVIATAPDGKIALSRIAHLCPDLVTLDIEMPKLNGIEVLRQIVAQGLSVGTIVLSTYTQKDSDLTMKALELGAFDFIPKRQQGSLSEIREYLRKTLAPMVAAFARRQEIKRILRSAAGPQTGIRPGSPAVVSGPARGVAPQEPAEIIAIGISTGGPKALGLMLPQIPENIGVPILIVQHMPAPFTRSLAQNLDAKCALPVREAVDGEQVPPNTVLLAPGGKHMKVAASPAGGPPRMRVTDDPPINSCKPSVDYLFRSVARVYGRQAAGVIMTGMGIDGTEGLKQMKAQGATVIAQDQASCVVFGMPKKPIELGLVDTVVGLDNLAHAICRTVNRKKVQRVGT